jgi:hypothetical protein
MKFRQVLDKTFIAVFVLLMPTELAFAQDKTQTDDCKAAKSAAMQTEEKIYFGESRKLGNGSVRSWVKQDEACKPTAIGVTFTEAALTGLPTEAPVGAYGIDHKVDLPPQASATPFNHISVDWNPKGHEPDHIYSVGHFDFHFYMISPEERQRITLQDDDLAKCKKQPAAEFVPEDYLYAPGSEIARMGAHWVYKNAHEFHGHPFTSTFIYGSYNEHFIFLEPMVSKAFLDSKPNLTEPVKQPVKFEKPGYYPTDYSVKYDPQTREYTVAFLGLTKR